MESMLLHRSSLTLLAVAAVLAVAACGGASTPTPTPSPAHSTAPTPTGTPRPPDTMSVSILATGVGTFDLAAFPVADLKNNASYHGAASVVAHFVTHRAGRTLGSLQTIPVNLGPGETLAVTAECVDACDGATSVAVTVTVGSWPTGIGPLFVSASAPYSCNPCHSAHGFGDVKGTLTPSSTLNSGNPVIGFAVCRNHAGAILGGGTEQYVWPSGTALAVDVPVVLNAAPASCALGASTGW
jgi:hypothetical protein